MGWTLSSNPVLLPGQAQPTGTARLRFRASRRNFKFKLLVRPESTRPHSNNRAGPLLASSPGLECVRQGHVSDHAGLGHVTRTVADSVAAAAAASAASLSVGGELPCLVHWRVHGHGTVTRVRTQDGTDGFTAPWHRISPDHKMSKEQKPGRPIHWQAGR